MPRSFVEFRVTGFRIDSKTIRKRNIPSHACTGISNKKRLGERISLMNRKGYVCNHTGDTSSKFVNYNSSQSKSANELEGGTFTPYIVISTKHVLKQIVTISTRFY